MFFLRTFKQPSLCTLAAFAATAILGFGFEAAAHAAPPSRVSYTVAVADIPSKTFQVTVKAENVNAPRVSFALPAWSPGWYILTNANKNISKVAAKDDTGKPLAVTAKNRHTWEVASGGAKNVTLSYNVLAKDQDPEAVGAGSLSDRSFGFFEPYLDKTNGFVPGPAALMYVVDGKNAPCSVTYKVPAGWKVASANEPTSDPATFTAADYDTLADQPAELGNFVRYDKTIAGVPFSIVIAGANGSDHSKLNRATWRIAEAGIQLFGKAPFPRYMFHFHFPEASDVSMGLEHLNSTVISMPISALRRFSNETSALIAHEFFHAWNIKRIRPEKLGPFDYTQAVRVKDLWWSEGVTDYYAPRLVVEAGLAGSDFWRGYMTEQISTLQNNDARKRVTLEASSLGAWEGRSEGLGGLSYYNKGLLVGLLLDIEMRRRTDNKVGMDDLMKALNKENERTGKGFPDGEIERLVAKLTGTDFAEFFRKTLRSTEELPYKEILPAAGLALEESSFPIPDTGFEIDERGSSSEGLLVGDITAASDADKAGIKKGDVVVAINGRVGVAMYEYLGGTLRPGDQARLTVLSGTNKTEKAITLTSKPLYIYRVVMQPSLTPQQAAIFASISGSKASRAAAR